VRHITSRERYRQGLRFTLGRAIGFVPSHRLRRLLYRRVLHMSIADTAIIYGGAEIRDGWNITIGENTSIGHHAILDGRDGLTIGDNVNLSTGVWIWTLQHDPQSPTFAVEGGPVVIEDHAWLSCRVTVLPAVRVGRGAVVAAGAVVTKSVDPFTIVGGVPAKVIGERSREMRYTITWHQPFF